MFQVLKKKKIAAIMAQKQDKMWHLQPSKRNLSMAQTIGFPGSSDGKESVCNVGDLGSIPGLERSPAERKSFPLQYSALENSMDCIVHGVTKSWTQLSDFHIKFSCGS